MAEIYVYPCFTNKGTIVFISYGCVAEMVGLVVYGLRKVTLEEYEQYLRQKMAGKDLYARLDILREIDTVEAVARCGTWREF